jgi:hypothetical protein
MRRLLAPRRARWRSTALWHRLVGAADEPARERRPGSRSTYPRRRVPVDAARLLGPEGVAVLDRAAVEARPVGPSRWGPIRANWSAGARHGLRPRHLGDELPRRALPARRQQRPKGFDCSGFTRHIFENSLGLVLPRRADEQAQQAGCCRCRATSSSPATWSSSTPCARLLARRHLRRRRQVHPRAAHRRRRCASRTCAPAYWAKRFNGARRAAAARRRCRAALPGPRLDMPAPPLTPSGRPAARHNAAHGRIRHSAGRPALRAAPVPRCRQPRRPTACWPTAWAGRCATCASRSPTAATSAAATACPRRCSTSHYKFLPQTRC